MPNDLTSVVSANVLYQAIFIKFQRNNMGTGILHNLIHMTGFNLGTFSIFYEGDILSKHDLINPDVTVMHFILKFMDHSVSQFFFTGDSNLVLDMLIYEIIRKAGK